MAELWADLFTDDDAVCAMWLYDIEANVMVYVMDYLDWFPGADINHGIIRNFFRRTWPDD